MNKKTFPFWNVFVFLHCIKTTIWQMKIILLKEAQRFMEETPTKAREKICKEKPENTGKGDKKS
ncbi:MAG: hypothetical protein IJ634_07620 [Bacteroidales bacterium]|nr:hypothetical protein [Bacteroidales bacterium]